MSPRRRYVLQPDSHEPPGPDQIYVPVRTLTVSEAQRGTCFRLARAFLTSARYTFGSIMADVVSRMDPDTPDADIVVNCLAVFAVEDRGPGEIKSDEFEAALRKIRALPSEFLFWTCYMMRSFDLPVPEAHDWIAAHSEPEIEVFRIGSQQDDLARCLIEEVLTQGASSCRRNLVVAAMDDLQPVEHLVRVVAAVSARKGARRSYLPSVTVGEREAHLAGRRVTSFREVVMLGLSCRPFLPA